MTNVDLTHFFRSRRIIAHAVFHSKTNRLVFRLHPDFILEVSDELRFKLPVSIFTEYLPMRLWDFWCCRKKSFVFKECK